MLQQGGLPRPAPSPGIAISERDHGGEGEPAATEGGGQEYADGEPQTL